MPDTTTTINRQALVDCNKVFEYNNYLIKSDSLYKAEIRTLYLLSEILILSDSTQHADIQICRKEIFEQQDKIERTNKKLRISYVVCIVLGVLLLISLTK